MFFSKRPTIEYDKPEASAWGPFNSASLFIIDKTLEPGTPLRMCVDDNCESEAVSKGYYDKAILEVDMKTTNTPN